MSGKRTMRHAFMVMLASFLIACIPALAFADVAEAYTVDDASLDQIAASGEEAVAPNEETDSALEAVLPSGALASRASVEHELDVSAAAAESDVADSFASGQTDKPIADEPIADAEVEASSGAEPVSDDFRPEIDKLADDYRGTLEEGKTYYFNFNVSSTAVLDISGASQDNGGNAQIYDYNATPAQQWFVTHDSKGYLTLTAVHSGKVLDVMGALVQNGTNVWQYEANGTYAQKWIAVPIGDGLIELHSALDFNYALDAVGANSANCTNVQIYVSNGSNAQLLRPLCANPDVAPCDDLGLDGWYTISASGDTTYVLDVASASTSNGANVQIFQANTSLAQFFRFEYADGYYFIVNARSGKALDVEDGSIMPGTNIQQWDFNTTNQNQMFSVVRNDDGTYTFISKRTGLCVDICSARLANMANIQGYTGNGTAAQRFFLSPVTDVLAPGIKEVAFANASGQRLDVAAAKWDDGTNVQAYEGNGTLAQKWYVSKVVGKENVYAVESVVAGGMLTEDVDGNICIRTATGQEAQQWRVRIDAGGLVLTNVATGHELSVAYASLPNCTNVVGSGVQAPLVFNDTAPMPDGYFIIKVRGDMSHVIDLCGASISNGAAIQMYERNDTGAQRWKIACSSDGSYQIICGLTMKSMDAENGAMANGTRIQQWAHDASNYNQKWIIEYVAGEGYRIAPFRDSSFSIAAAGNSLTNCTSMVLTMNDAQITQRFSFEPTTAPMTVDEQAMFDKAQGYRSSTSWLILVNCTTNRVGIYYGSQFNWQEMYYWECCTGAPSSPTVLGDYTVGIRGYSFDGHGYTCYYYTQFWGDYLFHSQVYDQGTFNIQDGSMGVNVSQGCVRLYLDRAKWIFDNIPSNTHVVTYRE